VLELIRARLEQHGCDPRGSNEKISARCPAHEDRSPSLSIGLSDDGRVLIRCHAGCESEAVVHALGLTWSDLYPGDNTYNGRKRQVVATYDYTDERDKLLFQVVRLEGKKFFLRRPDGRGGWIKRLDDARRVLYHLPRLLAAVERGEAVYVVEGEKDVHAAERAGVVATTNPMGAGKWRPEFSESLRGAGVLIVADRDGEGRKHAQAVAASLRGVGADVQIVEPVVGKDVSDHLAAGKGLNEVVPMEESEPLARPSLVARASAVKSRSIRWAWIGRLALGYLTVETGVEGLGKSVFAAWMIARLTCGDLPGEWRSRPVDVLIVAGEDGIADTWVPRLALAGADMHRVAFLNLDVLPVGWNLRDGIEQVREAVAEVEARVVFIDAALDHMPAAKSGESINSPTFVRQALGPLKQCVRDLDLAGIFSMHPPKARSADFRDLLQASQAFSAIPRVGLLFAWHPEDAELPEHDRRRVLIRGKGNLGRDPGAMEFRVVGRDFLHEDGRTDEREVVVDVQPSPITIADLAPGKLLGEREPTKAEKATDLLRGALSDGEWHLAKPIREQLARRGLDSGSVRNHAMGLAGVDARKRPGEVDGPWEWRIEESTPMDNSRALPLARARSPNDGGLSDFGEVNGKNHGKGPRVDDPQPSDADEPKSPSAHGGRARTRAREDDGVSEAQGALLDPTLERWGGP
jgi:5S rRNA maturation endonuclease (ribonuclease M5)